MHAVIESIAGCKVDSHCFEGSVTDGDFVVRCIDEVLERFGRIDILATVAGITSFGEVESITEDE
jgi:NAD(P)-dependent dehydrogenase (short-subunit alcohol dehydrogenase family)